MADTCTLIVETAGYRYTVPDCAGDVIYEAIYNEKREDDGSLTVTSTGRMNVRIDMVAEGVATSHVTREAIT